MDETTPAPGRRPHRRAGAPPYGKRGRRPWSRLRIALLTAGGLAALLAWNTLAVSTETADATGGQLVRVPGGDLHVVQDGPRGAPVVVLLHGLAGSTRWWIQCCPRCETCR